MYSQQRFLTLWLVVKANNPLGESVVQIAMGITIVAVLGIWAIRRRLHNVAIFTVLVSFPTAILAISLRDPSEAHTSLTYLVIGIFLCSILTSMRNTLIFALLNVALVFLLAFVLPSQADEIQIAFSGIFVFTISAFFFIVLYYHNLMEQNRRATLTASEAKLRAVVENTSDMIYIIDRQGQPLLANPASARDLDSLFVDPINKQVLYTGETITYESTQQVDGAEHTFLTTKFPYVLQGNQIQGVVGITRDVTELKKTESQLQRYNRSIIALQHASVELSGILDLEKALETLIKTLHQIFPQSIRVSIQVLNPDTQTMQTRHASPDQLRKPIITFRAGYGVAGIAIREHRLINVSDVLEDKRFVFKEGEVLYRSIMVVPLITSGGIWGTISISAVPVNGFDATDEAVAEMLARQVGAIIDNIRLFEAEHEQRLLSETQRDTAAALNSALGFDELLDLILELIERVVATDAISVILLDDTEHSASIVRERGYDKFGLDGHIQDIVLNLDEYANLRHVYKTHYPLVIPDVDAYPNWRKLQVSEWIKSHITVPILSGDKVIGFLGLDSQQKDFFGPQDGEKLIFFANQVGVALEKARLFVAELQQREIAETLRDVGLILSRSLSLEDRFPLFLAQVARVTPYTAAGIWLCNAQGMAHYAFGIGYAELGLSEIVQQLTFDPRSDPLLEELGQKRRVSIISDSTTYTRPDPNFEWIKSWAGIPILLQGELYGYIALDHKQVGFYTNRHIPILEALGTQLSIAMENATLLQKVRENATFLEQRIAERTLELEQERAQLEAILDTLDEGVLYIEDNNKNTFIRYANEAFCRLTEYEKSEVVGRSTVWLYEELFISALAWPNEMKLRTKTGRSLDVSLNLTLVNASNERMVVVLRDITKEKTLQAQKERFITNASHELRTPMSNLMTRAYLLRLEPDKLDTHLSVMERTLNRLNDLAEHLLDFTEYTSETISLHCEYKDVLPIFQEIVDEHQASAQLKNISLVTDFPPSPLVAYVDEHRFYQVVNNLIFNTISYGTENTKIKVHVTFDSSTLYFSVEDYGKGIVSEHLDYIFDPFFRASEGRVRGTGLGLSIAKEIVELHGGKIGVESQVNGGSRFWVKLPLMK